MTLIVRAVSLASVLALGSSMACHGGSVSYQGDPRGSGDDAAGDAALEGDFDPGGEPLVSCQVFPAGQGVHCGYSIVAAEIFAGTPFVLSRTLTNASGHALSGMYLSEHLPLGIEIHSQALYIDGSSAFATTIGPLTAQVIPAAASYYWLLDSLGEHAGSDLSLASGQEVRLELELVAAVAGSYLFPLATWCWFGGGSASFATADSFEINVSP